MVKKKLNSPDCHFLIMEENEVPKGTIRFDILERNFAVISYLIGPEFQGKGLGEIILKLGINDLRLQKPDIVILKGKIINENYASARIFEKSGFYIEEYDNYSTIYSKRL